MESVRTDVLPPGFRLDETRVNNVDPVEESNTNSLLAIQPLVVCLRFLGVELDPSILNESASPKCYRYTTLFIGLFFLLLNGISNIYIAITGKNRDTNDYNKAILSTLNQSSMNGNNSTTITTLSSVMSWNLIVDYVNYGVLSVGVHLSLFIVSRQQKWKLFWNNVQQILHHHNEFPDSKRTIRLVTIAGLLVIFSESLILLTMPAYFYEFNESHQIIEALLHSFANFLHVYAFAGLLLFAVIGWTVALGFHSLSRELINSPLLLTIRPETEGKDTGKEDELIELLTKWKRFHVLLCDTVDGINDCLGPVLLIWVAHIFVGFIAIPFYILDGIHFNTESFSSSRVMLVINFCLLAQHIFHFLIITGIPSRIWHEVKFLLNIYRVKCCIHFFEKYLKVIANGKLLQQVHLHDSYHLQDQVC